MTEQKSKFRHLLTGKRAPATLITRFIFEFWTVILHFAFSFLILQRSAVCGLRSLQALRFIIQ
jgi:hypothetical protein